MSDERPKQSPTPQNEPAPGPAPAQSGDDACDPTPAHDDADKTECPTGYPDRHNTPPQQPSVDDPKPKAVPTEEGD